MKQQLFPVIKWSSRLALGSMLFIGFCLVVPYQGHLYSNGAYYNYFYPEPEYVLKPEPRYFMRFPASPAGYNDTINMSECLGKLLEVPRLKTIQKKTVDLRLFD
jgi:hypothetical protein